MDDQSQHLVSHQVGVINKGIMAELANALGPRIRGGHIMRMDHGANADRVEMRKVGRVKQSTSYQSRYLDLAVC